MPTISYGFYAQTDVLSIRAAGATGFGPWSSVAATADGGFVVAYYTPNAMPEAPFTVHIRKFDALGNPVGAEVLLDSNAAAGATPPPSTAHRQPVPEVAVAADGRIGVVWLDTDAGQTVVRLQVLNADMTPSGDVRTVSFGGSLPPTSQFTRIDIAATPGSDFDIVISGLDGDAMLRTRVDGETGATLQQETWTGPDFDFTEYGHTVAVLNNGRTVIAASNDLAMYRSEIFTHGPSTRIAESGAGIAINDDPQVVPLRDGGYVIVWRDSRYGASSDISMQFFNADGTTRTGILLANQGFTSGSQGDPNIAELPNGMLVVSWTDGNAIIAAAYSAQGARINNPVVIGEGSLPNLIALADGTLAFNWNDYTNPRGEMRLVDVVREVLGDATAETFDGDALRDAVLAGGGNDTIRTFGGDDAIDGGEGDDTLEGGDGADLIIGGSGHDVIYGGTGDDSVDGGIGNDEIRGGDGVDVLYGWTGNDSLNGDAGADTLIGGEGVDTLNGGEGEDTTEFEFALSEGAVVRWGGVLSVAGPGSEGVDRLTSIEQLQFSNGTVAVSSIPEFRALDYIAGHDDLIGAFGVNGDGAVQHFIYNGFAEGRAADRFDGLSYLAGYTDLLQAIGVDEQAAAFHFITNGFAEGRSRDAFNELAYIAGYDDLIGAFGTNGAGATVHWVYNGFAEGRSQSLFDAAQYIASYGDLIQAFGGDFAAATQHFITNGFAEGRSRDSFDAAQYLANYADLQAAFGTNEQLATLHYIYNGYNEGRTDEALTGLLTEDGDISFIAALPSKAGDPAAEVLPGMTSMRPGFADGATYDAVDGLWSIASEGDLINGFGQDEAMRAVADRGVLEDKGDAFYVSPVEFDAVEVVKDDPGPAILPGDLDLGVLSLAVDDSYLINGLETPIDLRAKGIVMPPEWAVLGT